jgi:hypothetical protein
MTTFATLDPLSLPDVAGAVAPARMALQLVGGLAIGAFLLATGRCRSATSPRTRPARGALAIRRIVAGLATLAAVALGATAAYAQPTPDHLQCFKVSDATLRHLRGTVDIDAPSIGLAPGCRLSKAKLYCAPAEQQVQPGTLFDGGHAITELPYHGRPAESDRICYQVKCPTGVGTATDRVVTDRFGMHELTRFRTELVCTPATGGTLPPPAQGFQIQTPSIEVAPGQDVTWCYYFRTPNNAKLAVTRLASTMGPAGKGVVFFTTAENGMPAERRPAGDISIVGCEMYSGTTRPTWRYAGYGASDALEFPIDDGAGHPVAMELPAISAGVLMMHFKNETGASVTSGVTLNVEALDQPIYTPTSTLLSYDSTIAVPPFTTGHVETTSCAVPAGVQFWSLSTFAHKQAVTTRVRDAAEILFESFDWANPGASVASAPPFRSFASGTFTHACTYDNPTSRTLLTGPSQQTDENCLGIGYFFPATAPRLCYNGFVLE